jgi:hypothetical protein
MTSRRKERLTAFAEYVRKPLVLIEMKDRGTGLTRTYRSAPGRHE